MTCVVHHLERVPALLLPWAEEWQRTGAFDLVCTRGTADDAAQLLEWAKGRAQLPDGSWVIVDQSEVVTYAQTAESSAHGHGAGGDFHAVRELFPSGGVKLIYLGSKKKETPEVYAEAIRRFVVMAQHAEDFGLESGRHFPDPDLPHLQVPNWRALPLAHP